MSNLGGLEWLDLLTEGKISCCISQDKKIIQRFTPTEITDLTVVLVIQEIKKTVKADFYAELVAFVQGQKLSEKVECRAQRTVVRFGKAIQIYTKFEIEFKRASDVN